MSMFMNSSGLNIKDSTFIIQSQPQSSASMDRLEKAASPSAFHSYVGRPQPSRCYPNTRVSVLDGLKNWAMGLESPDLPLKWLNGGAGAGKSAVAQSFAELCEDEGLFVASFFFFRPDSTRNHTNPLVATLAYQLSRADPALRAVMDHIIGNDPHILNQDIRKQISSLIIHPVLAVRQGQPAHEKWRPCVIIIDGLDECIAGGETQAGVVRDISSALRAVGPQMREILPRFVICSRPEEPIAEVFRSPHLHGMFTEVSLVDDSAARDDICTYLKGNFGDIKVTHRRKDLLPASWPSSDELSILTYKASGHFIYAKVVLSVVSADARPAWALQAILGLRVSPQRMREPFAELDGLFYFILNRAEEHVTCEIIQRVLGFLSISESPAQHYHPDLLERFLELEEGDMDTFLSTVASLVSVQPGSGPMLRHKSFSDFLFDESRAGRFSTPESVIRAYVWTRSCELISEDSRCLNQGMESHVSDMSGTVIACLLSCISGSAIGTELHAAVSRVPLRDVTDFVSRHQPRIPDPRFKIVFCIEYFSSLLQVLQDQNEEIFATSGLYEQAENDAVSILRDYITSADYDYFVPALLLSRWSFRGLNALLGLNPWLILSIVAGKIQYSRQPILWALFSVGILDDSASLRTHARLLSILRVGDAYCLHAERYTQASILWIMKLRDSHIFWDTHRNLTFPNNSRRPIMVIKEPRRRCNAPFRWRLTAKAIRPFSREGRKHFVRTFEPILLPAQALSFTEFYRRLTFSFILSSIPAMLEKSSKSDALAALRYKSLAPLIACFPKRTKRARLAMEAYAAKHGYDA